MGFRGTTLAQAAPVVRAVADEGLGGVILFDQDGIIGGPRNISSRAQVIELISGLQDQAGGRLLVAIDQEGGSVARLTPATGFPAIASEASVGRANHLSAAHRWAAGLAATLHDVGVNLNLAPVLDVDVNPSNPAIGALGRSFSADPAVVARMALAEIAEHHARGVRTTLKHFPGLGSAAVNTDFGVADVTESWSVRELEPFRAVIDAGMADAIMVANLVNRRLDPRLPASLSRSVVTGMLRGQLGWDGVAVTDDLGAKAITSTFGQAEAIALAIEAGNDLILLANQQPYDPNITRTVIDIVMGLVARGRISPARLDESVARVARLRAGVAGAQAP